MERDMTQGLSDVELMQFRSMVATTLSSMFENKQFTDASMYFNIWRQTKDILEEELQAIANRDIAIRVSEVSDPHYL